MEENNQQQSNYIKGVIESVLFVNEKPVTLEQLKRVLVAVTALDIKKTIESLSEEYMQRG